MKYKKKIGKKEKFLLSYFSKYKLSILGGALGIIGISLLLLPAPLVTRYIVDVVIPQKEINMLLLIIFIVFIISLLTKYFSYKLSLFFVKLNARIIYDIRIDLFKSIQKTSLSISNKYTKGYLISRIKNDTMQLRSLFVDVFVVLFQNIVTIIIISVVVFFIDWKLALFSFALIPIYVLTSIYFAKIIKKQNAILLEKTAICNSQLNECLSLIELSKIYLKELFNIKQYAKKEKTVLDSAIKLQTTTQINTAILNTILGIIPFLILGYGGYQIINGNFTLGTLMAFNSFIGYIYSPLNGIINLNVNIQKSLTALERVYEIYSFEFEKTGNIQQKELKKIKFKNVNFSYSLNSERNIFKNLNLNINLPCQIGIFGESGLGKSTLIKLLLKLYVPRKGNLYINNIDIEKFSLKNYRKNFTHVSQEPILINDTIRNNILLGLLDEEKITLTQRELQKKIEKAIEVSGAKFIYDFPEKMNYIVGERGERLSVGQKQRIAIARALIRNPKVLIFDEPTSNLDEKNEAELYKTIYNLPSDISLIIISHKKKFLDKCNFFITFEENGIKLLKSLDK